MSRAESDLQTSLKKACSAEPTAPKRKHVRSCIVFTWDHRTSKPFWKALKALPLFDDEYKLLKALITIHKVLQEGHPSLIKDGIAERDWVETVGRIPSGSKQYGRLIHEYDRYILKKLDFHRNYRGFNGTFEYEEYVSLRTVRDPNEGYELILDLMLLQDAIHDLQKLVFATIPNDRKNECVISVLVPLVAESYGIYRFSTSMIRALNQSTDGDEALEPLRDRFNFQHSRLYEFYADCSSIRYLTSLITIPKLRAEPPNLFVTDDGLAITPVSDANGANGGGSNSRDRSASVSVPPEPEPLPQQTDLWQQQQQYQQEQARLELERQQQLAQQQQLQQQQQQYWLQQQAEQERQQKLAQDLLLQDQMQRQSQGQVANLEQDLLLLRGQYEKDQLMLEQYDQRVRALEQELLLYTQSLQQQLGSKDELLASLQEQMAVWKTKYESLAKLYSQLRQEHLGLLLRFKKVQQKSASAEEAIEKREKLEKEMKAKNIELADLIRERDRARMDLDRLKGGKNSEIERLETQVRVLQDQLDATERSQASNLTSIFLNHNKEVEALKRQLEEHELQRSLAAPEHLQQLLQEKDQEMQILQLTMDELIRELAQTQKENDAAMDEQIDQILHDHLHKLTSFVDSVLLSGIQRIQDLLYELDSPMQAGNQNASVGFLLSVVEKASNSLTEFATDFNNFIADGPNGDHSLIIKSSTDFSSAISGLVLDTKGLSSRAARTDLEAEDLVNTLRLCAQLLELFFASLVSSKLDLLPSEDAKTDVVIESNLNVQEKLQELSEKTEKLGPKTLAGATGKDLGELVDKEMNNAAVQIAKLVSHLAELKLRPRDPQLSAFDVAISDLILSLATLVTTLVQLLIALLVESQQEIVDRNRGLSSKTAFYKKHNRWTEGLISALKLVLYSTNILISTSDGVLSGAKTHEELIVASNEVAASTAQLVAASRVKAELGSRTQDKLEDLSKLVTSLCRSLVGQVEDISRGEGVEDDVDFSKLSLHENKTIEMEQQVEILKLDNALLKLRKRLGEIRKYGYRDESDEE